MHMSFQENVNPLVVLLCSALDDLVNEPTLFGVVIELLIGEVSVYLLVLPSRTFLGRVAPTERADEKKQHC
jgi:hypothetical protein